MKRVEWDAMTADDRRHWAEREGLGRACIERGCSEPAGTPWGVYWCGTHDDERLARISRNLHEMKADLERRRIE